MWFILGAICGALLAVPVIVIVLAEAGALAL